MIVGSPISVSQPPAFGDSPDSLKIQRDSWLQLDSGVPRQIIPMTWFDMEFVLYRETFALLYYILLKWRRLTVASCFRRF